MDSLWMFWQHLRGVSVSSNLGYRMKKCADDQEAAVSRNMRPLSKKYQEAVRIKKTGFNDVLEMGYPSGSRLGAGGFNPKLFIYRNKGWEPNCVSVVDWWIDKAKRIALSTETKVRELVSNLKPRWNSMYLRNILQKKPASKGSGTDGSGTLLLQPPKKLDWAVPKAPNKTTRKMTVSQSPAAIKARLSRKRGPDAVDLESIEKQTTQRSRFTQRERDMLLFLKALSYFLYPVYRLWFEPRVLRDLMHKHIPESRTKTASALLAALNRELCRRKERLEEMQLYVRRMETVSELVQLRNAHSISMSMNDALKEEIFLKGFLIAEKMILHEGPDKFGSKIDSVAALEKFLEENSVFAVTEGSPTQNVAAAKGAQNIGDSMGGDVIWKHKDAETLDDIKMSVLSSVVYSGYATNPQDGSFSMQQYTVFRSYPDRLVAEVLRRLRSQGFLSYHRFDIRRVEPEDALTVCRSDYSLSFFFRHFFYHKMHNQLAKPAGDLTNQLEEGTWTNLMKELPGFVGVVCSMLTDRKICFDVTLPDKAVVMGDEPDEDEEITLPPDDQTLARTGNSDVQIVGGGSTIHIGNKQVTKSGLAKMRQDRLQDVESTDKRTVNMKENASLRLRPCQLYGRVTRTRSPEERDGELDYFYETIEGMERGGEIDMSFDDWLMLRDIEERQFMRDVMSFLEKRGAFGATHEELEEFFSDDDRWFPALQVLVADRQVVKRAVAEPRYVAFSRADAWFVTSFKKLAQDDEGYEPEDSKTKKGEGNGKRDKKGIAEPLKNCKMVRFSPRPWLRPDGVLNRPMLRWMAEGLYLQVMQNPGILESALIDHFNPAVEPFLIRELLEFLTDLGCVEGRELRIARKEVKGAFASRKRVIDNVKTWDPTVIGLQHFTRAFRDIPMPEFTVYNQNQSVGEQGYEGIEEN